MLVTGVRGGAVVDPVVALAVAALEVQEAGLLAASDRLAHCRGIVPRSAEDTWQGPARVAYDMGLTHLRKTLVAAAASVDDALTGTRRCVATMRQQLG